MFDCAIGVYVVGISKNTCPIGKEQVYLVVLVTEQAEGIQSLVKSGKHGSLVVLDNLDQPEEEIFSPGVVSAVDVFRIGLHQPFQEIG